MINGTRINKTMIIDADAWYEIYGEENRDFVKLCDEYESGTTAYGICESKLFLNRKNGKIFLMTHESDMQDFNCGFDEFEDSFRIVEVTLRPETCLVIEEAEEVEECTNQKEDACTKKSNFQKSNRIHSETLRATKSSQKKSNH